MPPPAAAAPSGWRGRLPEGVRPYFEAAPLAAAFLGISSGFAFAMIGATLTTRLAQYGHPQERGHGVRAHVPGLQLQVPVGAAGRHRAPAGARPLRPAPLVAVARRRAGDGRRRLPRQRGPDSGPAAGGDGRDSRRRCRRHLRHRHRRLPHRAAGAAAARRRLRHVAVRLAHRCRIGGRGGAGDCRALRLGGRVCRVRAVRAARDARRAS